MTLNDQQIQEDDQRIFIYSTDEENLYGLSRHYKGKWITAKIYRCHIRKVHLDLPEILGVIHSRKHEFAQYEVWQTTFDPQTDMEETRIVGLYSNLRRALAIAHIVAAFQGVSYKKAVDIDYQA